MDYITASVTAPYKSFTDKFPEFCLKELMDNAVEFLDANYVNDPGRRIV
jgi:hypothetical protein